MKMKFDLSEKIHNTVSQPEGYVLIKDIKEFIKLFKEDKIEDLAEFMHNVYEAYAKINGWKTQENCQVKFKDLPDKNKQVMINTSLQVITRNNLRIDELAGEKLK